MSNRKILNIGIAAITRSPILKGPILRSGITICLLLGAMIIGFAVVNQYQHQTRAENTNFISQSTLKQPWGEVLDGAGHLWIAEPNCDAGPTCGSPPGPGAIGEYDAATLNEIQSFQAPDNINPVFLALDAQGTIWFTDPTHSLIGQFVPGNTPWPLYRLTGSTPYDLVFDNNGKLWYTDFPQGAVGLFDPDTKKFLGTKKTPTISTVYGITRGPDGTIWVAENNTNFIVSFTPNTDISSLTLNEHAIPGDTQHPGQHLITLDKTGNVWFSTGFAGQIGELPVGSATALTYCVSNTVNDSNITGIAADSKGTIWFTDSVNGRVGTLDPKTYANNCQEQNSSAGVASISLGASSHPNDGLVIDATDNVYVTQQYNNTVTKIPPGLPTPQLETTLPSGPVAKTWYFAEGRVGAGFREFITIGNPSPTDKCIVDITYLRENGNPVPIQVNVGAASRWTTEVGNDLKIAINGPGTSLATIVANDPISPCPGITAERPMYFNWHGDTSGSDVVGATQTAKSFYFADIPNGNGYTSFITVLNPPGGQAATVTVNYYSGGNKVGQQTLAMAPGMRGTIYPADARLPAHNSAIVTSTQPVVVERPAYFMRINGGFAGSINGASSVIGSQSLQHEWFLAEGYAGQNSSGGRTQENLIIANIDPSNTLAHVTINLEYIDGSKHPFQITVAPNSQIIWNVNQQGSGATSNEVSADITSTGGGIVVMRQMYFSYAHTIAGITLRSTGGTEITGQIGSFANYTFAEGFSAMGFNEWLTLQNPTNSTETIMIMMVNSLGNNRSMTITVGHNSRSTFDVTAYIRTNMGIAGNSKSYEVSMTVQSKDHALFVAERPMYFNTAGSNFPVQGGTDAFGYNGG